MARRRIKVAGADARAVWAVSSATAVGVVLAGAAPTGTRGIDIALVGSASVAVVWAGSSAPWWMCLVGSAVAAALAPDWWLLVVALGALAASVRVGMLARPLPWARACIVGAVLQVLARLGDRWILGGTAIAALATASALGIAGMTRRSRRYRRRAWLGIGLVVGAAVVAAGAFALAARTIRGSLEGGADEARMGIELLADGELDEAKVHLAAAADRFDEVSESLDGFSAQPARLVPVLSQHRRAVVELASVSAGALRTINSVLDDTDIDAVRVVNGRVDLGAIDGLLSSLRAVTGTLEELRTTIDRVDSPWLVAPIRDRLGELRVDVAEQEARGGRTIRVLDLLPTMLGETSPRRYFVAFTTPAEARGLGGFLGNWVEIEVDAGVVHVSRFGRTRDLNFGGDTSTRRVSTSSDWLMRYGRFDFDNGPDGTTGIVPWSNITVSPDFPSTAQVIADLYPQSGGDEVDGVVVIDVEAIGGLMALTGPVDVPDLAEPVDESSVVDLLLRTQYEQADQQARKDLLEEIALATVERLLGGDLPGPSVMSDVLGPLVEQDRISVWSADPTEEAMLVDMGLGGELPSLANADGLAVTVNNRGANKIDVYLRRSFEYRATIDDETGRIDATVTLTLANDAPPSGLPDIVLGNQVGQPSGTNEMYLSVFTSMRPVGGEVDGEIVGLETTRELGWWVHSLIVDIPPGEERVITLHLRGAVVTGVPYQLSVRPQPLVADEHWSIDVSTSSGRRLVGLDDEVIEPVTLTTQ